MNTRDALLSPSRRPSHKSLFAAGLLLRMENLYGFRNWGAHMGEVAKCFWMTRRESGFWNFGSACANPYYTTRIRLSDNWRGKRGAHDWTTRILILLWRYYRGMAKGVTFTLDPIPYGGTKISFIDGPEGTKIEVVEAPAK